MGESNHSSNDIVPFKERNYDGLMRDLIHLMDEGRHVAVRSVNAVLTATYWLMGRRIVEYEQGGRTRAEYGEELLKRLAGDLTSKLGRGFSERNLEQMRLFYSGWPISQTAFAKSDVSKSGLLESKASPSKSPTLASEFDIETLAVTFPLSWSHYARLLFVKNNDARKFYEGEAIKGGWSVRQLDRQIQSLLYERAALSKRRYAVIDNAHDQNQIIRPEEEIKDPYVLEFLNLKDEYSESQLEDALIAHLEHFLLELGRGFTFVARQKRFEIGGSHYRIDLLLYNRVLRSLVLIDLKIGEFSHADAGQMNFYLNWAKSQAMLPGENEPVGIILCSGKDKTYVQYSLGGLSNKIFVSSYQLQLPTPHDLRKELKRGRELFLRSQINCQKASGQEKAVDRRVS